MKRFENRRQETAAVKAALKAAGINAKVSQGRGTAWGWLEVNIGTCSDLGEHDRGPNHWDTCTTSCPACILRRKLNALTLSTVQEVTGRGGEWEGCISLLNQDHWNKSKGCSEHLRQAAGIVELSVEDPPLGHPDRAELDAENQARYEADAAAKTDRGPDFLTLTVNAAPEFVSNVRFPSLNKQNLLEEYEEQLPAGDYNLCRVRVTHDAAMNAEQYERFTSSLLAHREWLAGLGGNATTTDPLPEGTKYSFELTDDQLAEWRRGLYTLALRVTCPDRRPLYVDPQGFDYARYIGL